MSHKLHACIQEESDKRLAEAGGRHAQELAGQNKQVTRAQAEAASAAASAQGKLSSELQKHVAEMARVKEAAEKQIACVLPCPFSPSRCVCLMLPMLNCRY